MVKINTENIVDIINKIDDYMRKFDWPYSDWYVGVSPDPREKLTRKEMVAEAMGPWIYKMAADADLAKAVEKHFTEVLGTDGSSNSHYENARVVYAYKKNIPSDVIYELN